MHITEDNAIFVCSKTGLSPLTLLKYVLSDKKHFWCHGGYKWTLYRRSLTKRAL